MKQRVTLQTTLLDKNSTFPLYIVQDFMLKGEDGEKLLTILDVVDTSRSLHTRYGWICYFEGFL